MKVEELTWSKSFAIGATLVSRTRVLRPIQYTRSFGDIREHVVLQRSLVPISPIQILRKKGVGAGFNYVHTGETINDVVQLAFFLLNYCYIQRTSTSGPRGTKVDHRIPRR